MQKTAVFRYLFHLLQVKKENKKEVVRTMHLWLVKPNLKSGLWQLVYSLTTGAIIFSHKVLLGLKSFYSQKTEVMMENTFWEHYMRKKQLNLWLWIVWTCAKLVVSSVSCEEEYPFPDAWRHMKIMDALPIKSRRPPASCTTPPDPDTMIWFLILSCFIALFSVSFCFFY